jgi:hypothetical protein
MTALLLAVVSVVAIFQLSKLPSVISGIFKSGEDACLTADLARSAGRVDAIAEAACAAHREPIEWAVLGLRALVVIVVIIILVLVWKFVRRRWMRPTAAPTATAGAAVATPRGAGTSGISWKYVGVLAPIAVFFIFSWALYAFWAEFSGEAGRSYFWNEWFWSTNFWLLLIIALAAWIGAFFVSNKAFIPYVVVIVIVALATTYKDIREGLAGKVVAGPLPGVVVASAVATFPENPSDKWRTADLDSARTYLDFPQDSMFLEIFACESSGIHYTDSARTEVLRGRVDSSDVGIAQNNERIHRDLLDSLAASPDSAEYYDIYTIRGNVNFAKHLRYRKIRAGRTGLRIYEDWNASRHCWERHEGSRSRTVEQQVVESPFGPPPSPDPIRFVDRKLVIPAGDTSWTNTITRPSMEYEVYWNTGGPSYIDLIALVNGRDTVSLNASVAYRPIRNFRSISYRTRVPVEIPVEIYVCMLRRNEARILAQCTD